MPRIRPTGLYICDHAEQCGYKDDLICPHCVPHIPIDDAHWKCHKDPLWCNRVNNKVTLCIPYKENKNEKKIST